MAILEEEQVVAAGARGLFCFGPAMFAMTIRHICMDIEETVEYMTQEL